MSSPNCAIAIRSIRKKTLRRSSRYFTNETAPEGAASRRLDALFAIAALQICGGDEQQQSSINRAIAGPRTNQTVKISAPVKFDDSPSQQKRRPKAPLCTAPLKRLRLLDLLATADCCYACDASAEKRDGQGFRHGRLECERGVASELKYIAITKRECAGG
jgi:hypothetical protein